MDETPRFPSLFFRQRLNGIVLPMLGGIALFLLLPFAAALGIVGLLSAVCFAVSQERGGRKDPALRFDRSVPFSLDHRHPWLGPRRDGSVVR